MGRAQRRLANVGTGGQPCPMNPLSRRKALRGLALLAPAGWAAGCAVPHVLRRRPESEVVRRENERPGTRDWMLERTRVDKETGWRSAAIEGYGSRTRVFAGETIDLHVSTDPAEAFDVEFFRMGFYGGLGGRRVGGIAGLKGEARPLPPVGDRRLRDCAWPVTARWQVPSDAPSGVYLGRMRTRRSGLESYVVFVVRDRRRAGLMFQCSDNTWQAYNRWPDHFALYDNGVERWWWGGGVRVSFNRPYARYCQIFDQPLSQGSGEFLLWEFPVAYWLEKEGYDVTYVSNHDTHADPRGLLRTRCLLSVGHDEYWTREMFGNVHAAVGRGLSVAFLSGNAVCGRIEHAPGKDGERSFERVGVFGPPGGTREFVAMKSLRHERPYANELVGAHSTGPVTGGADWTCRRPGHWLFEGTGMKEGDSIPGLVGWEWHGDPAPIPGLEVVASGPTQDAPGKPNGGEYTATVYPGPMGNVVFNASTIWWGDGLSEPPGYMRPRVYTTPMGPDLRVQQITRNLLRRVSARHPSGG